MKYRIVTALSIVACSLLFFPVAKAQTNEEVDQFISAMTDTVRKNRMILISDNMQFSPQEAAAFWTVYEKYAEEMTAVQESRIELIKDYLTDIKLQATDETAEALTQRAFAIDENRLKVRQKYYPLFTKATSAPLATRFAQMDRIIDTAIDLKIAQAMPAYPGKMSEFIANEDASSEESVSSTEVESATEGE